MKNIKETLMDLASFLFATLITITGTILVAEYMKQGFTVFTFLMGLAGFFILYPAFKSWQDRFKDLF